MKYTIVTAANGVPFTVKLIEKGDRYGLEGRLTHGRDEPMVEFLDRRQIGKHESFSPDGQFVSRYMLSMLTADTVWGESPVRTGRGVDLDAGVPMWKIDHRALVEALAALGVVPAPGALRVGDLLSAAEVYRQSWDTGQRIPVTPKIRAGLILLSFYSRRDRALAFAREIQAGPDVVKLLEEAAP